MPLRHNIINLLVRILKIYVYINITSVLRAFALPVENGADSDHFFQITGQNFDENLVKNSTQNSNSTIYSTPNLYVATFCTWTSNPFNKFMVELFLGAFSAIIVQTLTAPIERIKLIVQVESQEQSYTQTLKDLVADDENNKNNTLSKLWRGNTAALVKAVPQKALELAMTDLLLAGFKESLDSAGLVVRLLGNISCAGVTGIIVTLILYPLDVVRTRLAADTGTFEVEISDSDDSDNLDNSVNSENLENSKKSKKLANMNLPPTTRAKIPRIVTEMTLLRRDSHPASDSDTFSDTEDSISARNELTVTSKTSDESGYCYSEAHLDLDGYYNDENELEINPNAGPRARIYKLHKGGVFSTMNQIRRLDGISGLYQGLGISCFGAFFYVGMKLGLLEFFDNVVKAESSSDETEHIVSTCNNSNLEYYIYIALLSWICSVTAGFLCYPIETIRRKMMVLKFDSWLDCYRTVLRQGEKNHAAFFNGCMANFVLSVTSMMIITLYKIMKTQLFQQCEC